MNKKLVIYGAGSTGEFLASEHSKGRFLKDYNLAGFIDDIKTGRCYDYPILGDRDSFPKLKEQGIDSIVITLLEHPQERLRECRRLESMQFNFPNVIPYTQNIDKNTKIGKGVIIDKHAYLFGTNIHIGNFCVIGPYSVIENSTLEDGVVLCPLSSVGEEHSARDHGKFIGQGSRIGEGSVLYPRAVVLPNVKIGNNCVIGPNVVIHKEIKNNTSIPKQKPVRKPAEDELYEPDASDFGEFSLAYRYKKA